MPQAGGWVGGRTGSPFARVAEAAAHQRVRPVLGFVLGLRTPPAAPANAARVRGACGGTRAHAYAAGRDTFQPCCDRADTADWCTSLSELPEPIPDTEHRAKPKVVGITETAGLRGHEPPRLESGGQHADEPDPSSGGVRVTADIRSPEPVNDARYHADSSASGQGGPPAIEHPHSQAVEQADSQALQLTNPDALNHADPDPDADSNPNAHPDADPNAPGPNADSNPSPDADANALERADDAAAERHTVA